MQPSIDKVKSDQRRFALEWERIQADSILREQLIQSGRIVVDPTKIGHTQIIHILDPEPPWIYRRDKSQRHQPQSRINTYKNHTLHPE